MNDTIAAIATANINQAISIIRMSGSDAIKIIKKIFSGKIGKDKTISYGFIMDKNKKIDEVLINFFVGKDNFVGEDTIEIMCHGGVLVTNNILELLLINGARQAERGEFSRRSFLNGKMDLIKAEAINDLINSKTQTQTKIAINKFDNHSSKIIKELIHEIELMIGICEVNIDYPEYDDVEKIDSSKINKLTKKFISKIDQIIKSSESNQIYSTSLKIAIVGKPNSGKSELMNKLLKKDKSIVAAIEGTTRDVVEDEIVFNDILFKISDTAGIRKSDNEVEEIGIKKSFEEIEKSQIVFHILDATKEENEFDKQISKRAQNKIYLKLFNKKDLIKEEKENNLYISAKNNDLVSLKNKLDLLFKQGLNLDNNWFFNNRETTLLKKAKGSLENVIKSSQDGFGFEVIIVDLYEAWESMKLILGKVDKEELLDEIFKNFCLGK